MRFSSYAIHLRNSSDVNKKNSVLVCLMLYGYSSEEYKIKYVDVFEQYFELNNDHLILISPIVTLPNPNV